VSVPELVGAAINLAVTDRLLDAQKEARQRLVPFAERALAKSQEQFNAQMGLRNFDGSVYAYIRGLPTYRRSTQNIYRGQRTGSMQSVGQVKINAFGISRYNCGDREAAINGSLTSGIVTGMEGAANAGNLEDTLEAAYLQLRWISLANSARFSASGVGRAFSDTAGSLIRQAESLGSAAEASLASTVELASSAFLKANDRNKNKTEFVTPAATINTGENFSGIA